MASEPAAKFPTTIPAVVTRAGGPIEGPESLVDTTIPAPGPASGHDLLVDVQAISVNPVDTKLRVAGPGEAGERVLGWDASGIGLAVGPQTSLFQAGDEVYYAGSIDRPGSYQRIQLVDERIVARKPISLSHEQAAAMPLTGLTAWEGLFDKFGLEKRSRGTLLVIGAAGGVGSMVIQLAKALTGLTVIATASRPQSQAWVRELGADHLVDHHDPQLAQHIRQLAPEGVDYIYSTHSAGLTSLFASVTRPFGHILATDEPTDIDYLALKDKALSWHWEFMFARPLNHAADLVRQHEILERIAQLVDSGTLRTTLTAVAGPVDARHLRAAHADLEAGHVRGKMALSWQD